MHSILFCVYCVVFSAVRIFSCVTYVDITDGVWNGLNITKDGITYTPNDYVTINDTIKGCVCNVTKCCAQGEIMNLTTRTCFPSTDDALVPTFSVYNLVNVPENQISYNKKVKPSSNDRFVTSLGKDK